MKKFEELDVNDIRDFAKIYDYMNFESKLPKRADAIVVGGAGTRVDMAERAAELFREKRAPVIVFSGFAHPDFGINESEILSEKAIELGVPKDRILREANATNTGLNIQLSAKILEKNGIFAKKVILVHRPFMTRRFLATAEMQWPDPKPEFFVTSAKYNFVDYFAREDGVQLAERSMEAMLKNYENLDNYFQKGFSSRQPKDLEVKAAFVRLMKSGFIPRIQK